MSSGAGGAVAFAQAGPPAPSAIVLDAGAPLAKCVVEQAQVARGETVTLEEKLRYAAEPNEPLEIPRTTLERSLSVCESANGIQNDGVDASQFHAGDHLMLHCGLYSHHGIYLGDNRVIHRTSGPNTFVTASFSADASVFNTGGGLFCVSLEEFAKTSHLPHSKIHVVRHPQCFNRRHTTALAIGRILSPTDPKDLQRYRLLQSNCEHFATWCKIGVESSLQVLFVRGILSNATAVVLGLLGGIACLSRMRFTKTVNTTTTESTRHDTGSGMAKVLGYGHKTVRERVVREVTAVDVRKVVAGSGLVAAASPLIYRGIRSLQTWFLAQQGPLASYHIVSSSASRTTPKTAPRRINIDMGEFEQLEAVGVIKLPSKLRSVKHLKAYLQVHLALDSPIREVRVLPTGRDDDGNLKDTGQSRPLTDVALLGLVCSLELLLQ